MAAAPSRATTNYAVVVSARFDADPLAFSHMIADSHYGGASTRTTLGFAGAELTVLAQPVSAK
jgi:hypothetical protein